MRIATNQRYIYWTGLIAFIGAVLGFAGGVVTGIQPLYRFGNRRCTSTNLLFRQLSPSCADAVIRIRVSSRNPDSSHHDKYISKL